MIPHLSIKSFNLYMINKINYKNNKHSTTLTSILNGVNCCTYIYSFKNVLNTGMYKKILSSSAALYISY